MYGRLLRLKDSEHFPARIMLIGETKPHFAAGVILSTGEDDAFAVSAYGGLLRAMGPVGTIVPNINLASPFWARWDDEEQAWYGGATP